MLQHAKFCAIQLCHIAGLSFFLNLQSENIHGTTIFNFIGIQSVRKSILGGSLPSPRLISTRVHRDRNEEMPTLTLMFMQWGQFLDHDITATAQARAFNNSIPRCCLENGEGFLPPEFKVNS